MVWAAPGRCTVHCLLQQVVEAGLQSHLACSCSINTATVRQTVSALRWHMAATIQECLTGAWAFATDVNGACQAC